MALDLTVLSLLDEVRKANIRLEPEGDSLLCHGELTPELAERIARNKKPILEFIRPLHEPESINRDLIVPDPAMRFDPFPLNENQQAYWLGRDAVFDSSGVGIHVFIELADEDLDFHRVEAAWKRVYGHHDMLRAVVLPDGRQRILDSTPEWSLRISDFCDLALPVAEERLQSEREALSHSCADPQVWPSWELHGIKMPAGKHALLLSIDCWALDGRSLQILAADFAAAYHDLRVELPKTELSFRDYVLGLEAERETGAYSRALEYWKERVRRLPGAPDVPRSSKNSVRRPRFIRHSQRLSKDVHAGIKAAAGRRGLTLASVLIGCYAEVLARWSGSTRFTINVPRWNRHPLHPDVDQIVGEFATFDMLEVDLTDRSAVEERFLRLQRQFTEDLQHDIVSGVRILREWRKASGAGPETTVPYVFTHEPDQIGEGRARAWLSSFGQVAPVVHSLTQTPQVWIDAQYHDLDGELLLIWDALDSVFPDKMIDEMFAAYAGMVERLALDAEAWQALCPIDLPSAQQLSRAAANDTDRLTEPLSFQDSLAYHARKRADAPAIADREGIVSWCQLAVMVDATAARLYRAGVKAGDLILVAMEKGAEQIIAALALNKIGSVCVPVDVETPGERLAQIFENCNAEMIMVAAGARPDLKALNRDIKSFEVQRSTSTDDGCHGDFPDRGDAGDLHCILFTSGSTGMPKGVMVSRPALENVVRDGIERFEIADHSRILSLTPFHHDMCMFDVFSAVATGACIVLPTPEKRRDPEHWLALAGKHDVTFWNSVPAMMTMMLDFCDGRLAQREAHREALGALHSVTLGGDWIPLDTARRLQDLSPRASLYSVGGPTETTVWNICHPVAPEDAAGRSIPYGRPTANNRYHVLNERMEDCPDWVPGELFCAGVGVALGYLGDQVRTDAVFVEHPISGERLYRTGDRGRYRSDGTIEFLGRQDNQINLNGYRLELGEIEARLAKHPAVAQAVAVAIRDGNLVRSIHVWVKSVPDSEADELDLMAFAKSGLPRQMHPGSLSLRLEWPLTANGKIDRRALEDAVTSLRRATQTFHPQSDTERLVAEAWNTVLGAPPAERDANFFASGGDSIDAIRLYNELLVGRVKEASVLTLFRHPHYSELVHVIDSGLGNVQRDLPTIESVANRIEKDHPATAAQSRIWLEETLNSATGIYNLCFCISIEGTCDETRIRAALDAVIEKWETLRTALVEAPDGSLRQRLTPAWRVDMGMTDLSGVSDKDAELKELESQAAARHIDIAAGRGMHAQLITLSPSSRRLLLTLHHAFCDGWSFNLFLDDFQMALQGKALPTPTLGPIDYAHWEASPSVRQAVDRQVAWWHSVLQTAASGTELTQSLSRPLQRASEAELRVLEIPLSLAETADAMARRLGTTRFKVYLAVFVEALRRLVGDDRIVIGTHVAQRDLPELDRVPGMLVNNIALNIDLDGIEGFDAVCHAVSHVFDEGWRNGLAPFNRVVEALGGWRDLTRHPLYGITFTHENSDVRALQVDDLVLRPESSLVSKTPLDLEMSMAETPEGSVSMKAVFRPDIVSAETVGRLFGEIETVLAESHVEKQSPSLPPVGRAKSELVDAVLAYDYDFSESLTDLFDRVAQARPDDPALLDSRGEVTARYKTLAEESHKIAAALSRAGLVPGQTVAIRLPRRPDLIAAMFAVWRCGSHFVAISPDQPAERAALILEDAGTALLVTDVAGEAGDYAVLTPSDWVGEDSATVEAVEPDELAFLIYTSGTTGQPNGVEFTRRALLNRLHWQWATLPYADGERCIARTAVEFGDFPAEIFGPLLSGHALALIDNETARDPACLVQAVADVGARRLLVVPALLRSILEDEGSQTRLESLDQLEIITTSGEALPQDLADSLFEKRPDIRLMNFYGSSETGADATVATMVSTAPRVTAGRPLGNVGIRVVDDSLRDVAPGRPGQLIVSGVGLARGYRNRPELTAARFVDRNGERVFLTGDRAVIGADGDVLLLGRRDRQVKVRGQRIELDEVQSVISDIADVRTAAVTAVEGSDGLEIVAVFDGQIGHEALRGRLGTRLPAAAIPKHLVGVTSIPRTPGGKVDFKQIPEIVRSSVEASVTENASPPRTETEQRMAIIWNEVLGTKPRDRGQDFFASGGHSLAAARLAARIRRDFAVTWGVRSVFEAPILHHMASEIDDLRQGDAADAGDLEEFVL